MTLSELINNDMFQLLGWLMTMISGGIAVIQTLSKMNLKRENERLIAQIQILNQNISAATNSTRDRKIEQGESSQYIENASGPINIRTGKK